MKMERKTTLNGFTLIELLVVTAISALIVLSINTVLYNSFHLRDRAYESLDKTTSRSYAINMIKRDLRNLIPPNGELVEEIVGNNNQRGAMSSNLLSFYTTTGMIEESMPWGDIQKVEYSLMEARQVPGLDEKYLEQPGQILARAVTRNLTETVDNAPDFIPLLANVYSISMEFYDEENDTWQQSWDSTSQETVVPTAVRLDIIFYKERQSGDITDEYEILDVVVPILTKETTLEAESSETDDESEVEDDQSDDEPEENGLQNNGPGGNEEDRNGNQNNGQPRGNR